MKHSKHSKGSHNYDNNFNSNNEYNFDLYTDYKSEEAPLRKPEPNKSKKKSKKDKSDVILSKTPKTKKFYDFIAKILFILSILVLIALIIYGAITEYFGIPIVFVPIAALGFLVAIHMLLLSKKRKAFYFKRTVSLFLSLVLLATSAIGMSFMGLVDGFIKDIAIGGEENENQVDNISKHPFVVYLSGVDTRNTTEIKDKALSDVNMLVVVNPKQKRVLMVSTPRDYYVPLWGDTSKMDKLTHAGGNGIECSVETLEYVYDVEVNYYARVNFKSVCDIVDAVGGITVVSDRAFSSRYGLDSHTWHSYKEGENFLNGDAALAYARERKAFAEGDRMRGKHQQQVIEAVVKKAISPKILTNTAKVEDLIKAVSENTKTNFSVKEVKKLIQYQLKTMNESWKFESISVDGSGGSDYTYSYPSQRLYVMYPDQESVDKAKVAIDAVLKGVEVTEETTSTTSSN